MSCKVEVAVDNLSSRLTASPLIQLYSSSLVTKFHQALYSLERLQALQTSPDIGPSGTATSARALSGPHQEVEYYASNFWTHLRAGLDQLAQLLNQILKLGMDEKDVDIKQVKNEIKKQNMTDQEGRLDQLLQSQEFLDLETYRHADNHRHANYLESKLVTEQSFITAAFTAYQYPIGPGQSSVTYMETYLADNPETLPPTTMQRKRLTDVSRNIFENLEEAVKLIVDAIV